VTSQLGYCLGSFARSGGRAYSTTAVRARAAPRPVAGTRSLIRRSPPVAARACRFGRLIGVVIGARSRDTRPVVEAAIAGFAAPGPGIDIRRGVKVAELVALTWLDRAVLDAPVSPRTLLRRHAQLVTHHWTYLRRPPGRPAPPLQILVLRIVRENPQSPVGA
jgi:hypothetical protein